MNESSKKALIKYLIAAIIGFVAMFALGIGTAGILMAPLMGLYGILYAVGWYQSLIVDRMRFSGKGDLFQRNLLAWAFYILLVIFILWIVGDVKALIRIIKLIKE